MNAAPPGATTDRREAPLPEADRPNGDKAGGGEASGDGMIGGGAGSGGAGGDWAGGDGAGRVPALRAGSVLLVLACLAFAAIDLAHLGLIGAGEWQGDEWFNFALLRRLGTFFLTNRILTWSPRPVSEGIVYLYARLVDATGRPLIGGFLGAEWALLGLAAFALVPGRRSLQGAGRGARVLLGLAVATMFLLGHQVAEVFYWPMGAAAYLTALACLTAVVMLVLDGRHLSPGGRAGMSAAMVLAAGSAEVGAMASGCLALLFAGWELARGRPGWGRPGWGRPGGGVPGWELAGRLLGLAVPLAASVAVGGLILHGRASAGVALGPGTRTLHALGPSLLAAAAQFGRETLALDAYPAGWDGLLAGLAAKALLFLGLRWCCAAGGLRGRAPACHLWMVAVSLLAASFLSIAAALWQFGVVCCQRHDTLRQCLDVLALLALAGLAAKAGAAAPRPGAAVRGPVFLLLAAGIALAHRGPLAARLPSLAQDWGNYGAMLRVRQLAWASGRSPGAAMTFPLPPRGLVVGELDWPTGPYGLAAGPGAEMTWYLQGILLFFGKEHVTVTPPP